MNIIDRIDDIEKRLRICEDGLRNAQKTISGIQGQPAIRAAYGAQFLLNDTLDVTDLFARIERFAARLERGGL